MKNHLNRRTMLAVSAGAIASPFWTILAQGTRRLKMGHTGITCGFKLEDAQQAIAARRGAIS